MKSGRLAPPSFLYEPMPQKPDRPFIADLSLWTVLAAAAGLAILALVVIADSLLSP